MLTLLALIFLPVLLKPQSVKAMWNLATKKDGQHEGLISRVAGAYLAGMFDPGEVTAIRARAEVEGISLFDSAWKHTLESMEQLVRFLLCNPLALATVVLQLSVFSVLALVTQTLNAQEWMVPKIWFLDVALLFLAFKRPKFAIAAALVAAVTLSIRDAMPLHAWILPTVIQLELSLLAFKYALRFNFGKRVLFHVVAAFLICLVSASAGYSAAWNAGRVEIVNFQEWAMADFIAIALTYTLAEAFGLKVPELLPGPNGRMREGGDADLSTDE